MVREGSRCLDSALVSLDTVHPWLWCRRRLLRGECCGQFFLTPCGRASMDDQFKAHDRFERLAYFRVLTLSVGAQIFALLDVGPFRPKGVGITSRRQSKSADRNEKNEK